MVGNNKRKNREVEKIMIYPGRKSKSDGQFGGLQQTTDLYSDLRSAGWQVN